MMNISDLMITWVVLPAFDCGLHCTNGTVLLQYTLFDKCMHDPTDDDQI